VVCRAMASGSDKPLSDGGEGRFIVLEGVDGAGTTSQGLRLAETLREGGRRVHVTGEPSQGPVGVLLRQVLAGRLVVPAAEGPQPFSPSSMALLFAADRLDHLQAEVLPQLSAGVTVVCDRYYHSTLAYQSCTGGGSLEIMRWIIDTNRFARRPDLTVILDVSATTARERRQARTADEIYEREQLQQRLCAFYREIDRHFSDERIVHVDAERPFDEVAAAIAAQVRAAELAGC
jgi:dTMP kinase